MNESPKWPQRIWVVRHAESQGNVAREVAEVAGKEEIGVRVRAVDVKLSRRGRLQAAALGDWFGQQPEAERPTVVLVSPYQRAIETADPICAAVGICPRARDGSYVVDERLREMEFGILDGLTKVGLATRHMDQHKLRMLFGKFYYRPPGGESWADVVLRLRSLLGTITREYAGDERVLIVCHSVVVNCFRYLVERMTEQEILREDKENEPQNASVTTYRYDSSARRRGAGGLVLDSYNFVPPSVSSISTNLPPPLRRRVLRDLREEIR